MSSVLYRLSSRFRSNQRSLVRQITGLIDANKRFENDNDGRKRRNASGILVGVGVVAWTAYEVHKRKRLKAFLEANEDAPVIGTGGTYVDGLPTYTIEDVATHDKLEQKVWVTYKRGVYDITEFVEIHPGGEQILLAAGGSIEPFWELYALHTENDYIFELLETMRIGNLSEADALIKRDVNDPFSNDPARLKVLKPASMKPFNAEPPCNMLVDSFHTPNEIFYVRNHMPVPDIDATTYELTVEFEGREKTYSFTLEDLKKFPKHTITASIMCAGNRRSEMTKVRPVKGLNWENAAVGNATWTGARLIDVLRAAGFKEEENDYTHIQFEGLDTDSAKTCYGASIPIWKGIDKRGDVIVAYEMNDKPIPRDHGYPVRVVVPGVVGARSVKWLGKIYLSYNESNAHWQQLDYKGFSPSVDWDNVDFSKSPAIQELPVISSICKPLPGQTVPVVDGHIVVQGYAWSGGGRKIVRVDVTANGGDHWEVANIDMQDKNESPQHWSWSLWTATVPVPDGTETVEIWSKAVDSAYNTQPESFKHIWNLRGVLNNAYHRIAVKLQW